MKILTKIQALATLAVLGSAILVSATAADARSAATFGGGASIRGSNVGAHFTPPSSSASIARPNSGASIARPSFNGASFARPNSGASFARPSFTGANFGRPNFVGSRFGRPNFGLPGVGGQVPPAVQAANLGNPGHVNTGGTPNIVNTPKGPIFVPPNQPAAVTAAEIATGHVPSNTGGTPNIMNTPQGPIFVPPKQPSPVSPTAPLPPQPH